jgi:hypothetical protein
MTNRRQRISRISVTTVADLLCSFALNQTEDAPVPLPCAGCTALTGRGSAGEGGAEGGSAAGWNGTATAAEGDGRDGGLKTTLRRQPTRMTIRGQAATVVEDGCDGGGRRGGGVTAAGEGRDGSRKCAMMAARGGRAGLRLTLTCSEYHVTNLDSRMINPSD